MLIRKKEVDCASSQLIKLSVYASKVLLKKLCCIIFSLQPLNNQPTDFIKAIILFK